MRFRKPKLQAEYSTQGCSPCPWRQAEGSPLLPSKSVANPGSNPAQLVSFGPLPPTAIRKIKDKTFFTGTGEEKSRGRGNKYQGLECSSLVECVLSMHKAPWFNSQYHMKKTFFERW